VAAARIAPPSAPPTRLPATADFVVIGGGIIGLSLALELRKRHKKARIVVLEKEPRFGEHASGRNSGVLHAGFYYTADSLKARFTRDGCRRMTAWCEERGLPIRKCGKLVVCRGPQEHAQLRTLLERGRQNGVALEQLDEKQAREIEPRVRTCERALFSPATASVDPRAVMDALCEQALADRIELAPATAWTGGRGRTVSTTAGSIEAAYLVNAAGLYADRIARAYGFAERYRMLPFKGLYLYGNASAGSLAVHVYPVPDLEMPFLGTHFTVTVDGHIKIGPTALPALWLENYGGPLGEGRFFSRFSARELASVLGREARLMLTDRGFRKLAWRESAKMLRSRLVAAAAELVRGVRLEHFDRWGKPGIRAQLLDIQRSELVMDFCYEADERSLHVLNAVSPAFTCALPLSEHLADEIERQLYSAA